MAAPPKFTLEQYFAYDGIFEFQLEYHAGRILPVEITENSHKLILMNVVREIRWRIEDEFTTLFENQRLRPVPAHYVYTDLALVRDVPQYVDQRVDTLLNPRAVVEVCSSSSWAHDQVTKGGLYRDMPGCLEYWLIDCERVKAEHWTRAGANTWRINYIEDINTVFALESFGIEFPLARLYFGTIFGELPQEGPPPF